MPSDFSSSRIRHTSFSVTYRLHGAQEKSFFPPLVLPHLCFSRAQTAATIAVPSPHLHDQGCPTPMLKTGLCFEGAWFSGPSELTYALNISIKVRKSCLNRDYEILSVSIKAFCCFRSFSRHSRTLRDLHATSDTQILMAACAGKCFKAEGRK